MPNRRHHSKSRHGCVQCKARRTKCDEVRPVCAKCTRSGTTCSFSDDTSAVIFINGPNSRRSQNSSTQGRPVQSSAAVREPRSTSAGAIHRSSINPSVPDPSSPSPIHAKHPNLVQPFTGLEIDNLRLMRHFCTHAWLSIVSEPDGSINADYRDLWCNIVPELAFAHPFLLHALLAVSAVHLVLTDPSSNSTAISASGSVANLAQHHHLQSLPLLTGALSAPADATMTTALFAAAALMALFAFGHSQIPTDSTSLAALSTINDFAQALTILRGMSAIVHSAPGSLESTPFKVMFPREPSDPTVPLSPATEGYFAALKAAHARTIWPGGHGQAEAYAAAIEILRYTFLLYREEPGRQGAAVPFAVYLPELVLSGIREYQPIALCLLAGYATILHWLKKDLWIQGWGRRVMDGLRAGLGGSEWEEVIAWPLQVVGSDAVYPS